MGGGEVWIRTSDLVQSSSHEVLLHHWQSYITVSTTK